MTTPQLLDLVERARAVVNTRYDQRAPWEKLNEAIGSLADWFQIAEKENPLAGEIGTPISAIQEMARLTDEERVEVLSQFCNHCGSKDPRCQCSNDE